MVGFIPCLGSFGLGVVYRLNGLNLLIKVLNGLHHQDIS